MSFRMERQEKAEAGRGRLDLIQLSLKGVLTISLYVFN